VDKNPTLRKMPLENLIKELKFKLNIDYALRDDFVDLQKLKK
jgi:hypothetical protein